MAEELSTRRFPFSRRQFLALSCNAAAGVAFGSRLSLAQDDSSGALPNVSITTASGQTYTVLTPAHAYSARASIGTRPEVRSARTVLEAEKYPSSRDGFGLSSRSLKSPQ